MRIIVSLVILATFLLFPPVLFFSLLFHACKPCMHVRMSDCQRFHLHGPSGNASQLPPERLMLDRQESLAPVSCSLNINDICTLDLLLKKIWSVYTPVWSIGNTPRRRVRENMERFRPKILENALTILFRNIVRLKQGCYPINNYLICRLVT